MPQWAPMKAYSAVGDAIDDFDSGGQSWKMINSDRVNDKLFSGQIEIMKANLHGTHLWLPSLFLDQIGTLLQKSSSRDGPVIVADVRDSALKANGTEREDVCRQMLHMLHSMQHGTWSLTARSSSVHIHVW